MIYFIMSIILLITAVLLAFSGGSHENIIFVTLSSIGFLILSRIDNLEIEIENSKGGKKKRR